MKEKAEEGFQELLNMIKEKGLAPSPDLSRKKSLNSPLTPPRLKKESREIRLPGNWDSLTAGGCINHSTFRNNPQYLLQVKVASETLQVELSQPSGQSHPIGFYLAKSATGCRLLFVSQKSLVSKAGFHSRESVSIQVEVQEGEYVIIPCTFDPNQEGEFLLHVKQTLSQTPSLRLQLIDFGLTHWESEWKDSSAGNNFFR